MQEEPGVHRGYEYSRPTTRPARRSRCLASLEGAAHGLAFASGMSAEDTLLRTLSPGDHIVLGNDAYGGTFRLISAVLAPMGFAWTATDLTDPDALRAAMRPRPRSCGRDADQPLLTVVDISAIAEIVHEGDARLVVDNTFATRISSSR